MGRHRKTGLTLALSRIYMRHKKYAYFSRELLINPKTGRATRWHVLCPVADGELRARMALDALLKRQSPGHGTGNFGPAFKEWKNNVLRKRDLDAPKDPARLKIWQRGTKTLLSVYGIIENAFADFDLDQIMPTDIATFVDQWSGRRSAEAYRAHLTKFFAWCCSRKGSMKTNPAREVEITRPPARDVYITDDHYVAIRNALLIGRDGRPTRTGEMVQCYMDLSYLLYQRGTDIRLLRRDQVTDEGIAFKPSKTERSSGRQVKVPLSEDAKAVLARAQGLGKVRSIYVIHTEHGQPYTAGGIASLFKRACARAGVNGVTLKDIRAKAATDAKTLGYGEGQIQIALAHTDRETTRVYLRGRELPVSEVMLELPKKKLAKPANTPMRKQPRRERK
jgi:integrase